MKKYFLILFLFIASICVFAESKVINPEPGIWANTQMLVLNVEEGDEAYYSINGADPLVFGFAYEKPVMIDMNGSVELRVTFVLQNGEKIEKNISYKVVPSLPTTKEELNFVKKSQNGIDYLAGSVLEIPESFLYTLGGGSESFLQGGKISYTKDCVLSRYIPCTVFDGSEKWRFIIHTVPTISGSFSRRDVPFEIKDWDTIIFNDKNLIYKIDDEYWSSPKVPSKIDRTISHTISWQSIEVLPGNPVESFTLPSKPDFSITKATDGALTVSVEESEGYAFCVEGSSSLFKSTIADTFWGDEVFGELKLSVYYNSVFQGFEYVPFSVDKKRPSSPVIASSSEHFFSRQPVSLNISGDESAQLFVAISEPLIVLGNVSNTETIELFNSVEAKDFAPSSNTLILDSNETEAVFFKVVSYYVDKSGNKSDESVYGVLIDKHNYFVDSSNTHSSPDGSEENPFTSFEQCLEVLKNVSFMNINLSGHIVMPKGETSLYSNCRIKGNKDGRLIFPHASSLAVRSATLEIIDCVLERLDRETEESVNVFIKLEHALLSFQNCEVSVLFSSNGTAIQSTSSSVMIKESGLSSSTPSYSSCISAVDSKLNITSSRLSSAGSTVVNISAQGSELELSSTNCKLTGTFGRAVELFSSKSVLKDNVFFAELTNSNGKDDALFVDARTLSLEYSGNTIRGF